LFATSGMAEGRKRMVLWN